MITTVMPIYNITPELQALTEAALPTVLSDEMIIVDNCSTIGGGFARSSADIYVRNNSNAGYPKAVNQAFYLSHGDLIAIANNDIRVSPNWKEVALDIFKDPTVGSVHFKMINYDDPMILGNETWIEGMERWCTASFFVIRREAFVVYDEGYGAGGYDDWDFFHRMRHLKGWKTAYTNKAVYQHGHSKTYQAMDQNGEREKRDQANREHFKEKFGDYAEDIWQQKYPEQMSMDYYSNFK